MINIRSRINNLVKKYGTRDPVKPVKIAHALGINITYMPLKPNTKGFFIHIRRNKYIVINSNLSEFEQRIVLTHELGHAILHSNRKIDMIRKYTLFPKGIHENEANEFVAELLIPDVDQNLLVGMTYDQIGQYFGVPKELVMFKFNRKKACIYKRGGSLYFATNSTKYNMF
ncbi:ImmA/IrrE family metallo-endopeptidase [Candidatus Formimonas warabiya]|uniref:IrrE N-terminal-like domain-containing protein n=1 Tax=Formimonas warabiya TaxID=1761012 RepID=A0A3G1KQ39_FORW1|nr:ImmA/IrrE family metallo-endopeptidase [Candidatus Formimonas warabiya]ATW24571.1 hypothetical protein DCMF_07035 [Candidatus Formimonas warabiya]